MFYKWTLPLSFCMMIALGQEYQLQTQRIPRKIAEAKVDDFKLRLHQALETMTTLWRSSLQRRLKLIPVITSQPIKIATEITIKQACTIQMARNSIVFVLTSGSTFSMIRNFQLFPVGAFSSYGDILSLQAFEYGNGIWLITHVNRTNSQYIKVYKFNFSTDAVIPQDQRISSTLVSSTTSGHDVYMGIARTSVFPTFKLFRWTGTQFDEVLSTTMDNTCTALEVWEMEGTVYAALSFRETRRMIIQQFLESFVKMHILQLLDVEARVIKHLNFDGNHYLVCGTQDSVIFYWWTGSEFMMTYMMRFDSTVKDIAIHTLSERAVIAVVFTGGVKFLAQEQASSTRYILAGSVDLNSANPLKSVVLWKNGTHLYMLPLFEEIHAFAVYEIALKFEVSDFEVQTQLKDCVRILASHVNERQKQIEKLSSIAKNIWSSSGVSKILPSLKVNGTVISLTNSSIGSLHVPRTSSPFPMLTMAEEMTNSIEQLNKELKNSVCKSRFQFLENGFTFKNLVVNNGTIFRLEDHLNLNKINTTRLPFALKKRGHQTFEFYTNVANVSCNMAKATTINNNKVEDFLLLNSDSVNVTGWFKFSNASVKRMIIHNNRINGVNVADFVLTSNKGDVYGTKKFKSLSAGVVLTDQRVGEVQLNKIKELLDNLDLKSFSSRLSFTSDFIIQGNLNVTTLNGYDIIDKFPKFVQKNGKQDIHGKKIFKSMRIENNMVIHGKFNKCALNHLMTVTTDQKVYRDVVFSGSTRFRNILTDSLNGVDLSEQAFVRFRDVKVRGIKNFRQTLTVSDILMKDDVLIDSVDPSTVTSEIIYKSDGADVIETYHFNKNVTVGNIVAVNVKLEDNSFSLLEDIGNVWLKTTEQNISSLQATNMKVNMLQVSKINDVSINDFITVGGNDNIRGLVKFNDDVSTKSLNLVEGSNFNFTSQSLDPKIEIKIMNNITLEKAVFEGNISIGGCVKGAESGFMHVEEFQTLKDNVEFERIEMKELRLEDLKFQLLNNINFTDYFEHSVVPFKNRSIINKHFLNLKGTVMMCHGTLNNLSLDRVVTINTKQKIVSSSKFKETSFDRIQVKSFFDGVRLEDIVYVDEIGKLSNKQFNGNVTTAYMKMSRYLNDVDITYLHSRAFNKSKRNVFEKAVAFYSNVTAEELKVVGSKIDNVDLKDLIRLNESIELERLNATSIIAVNASIKGLVNGCEWMSIQQNALLFSQFPRNVTSRTAVKSLVVDGNLSLQYLNGSNIPDWISLLCQLSSTEFDENVTFENLIADNVQIQYPVNNVSIDFLVNDAVRKKVFQVISSVKIFQEISMENVTIIQLNSIKTCGFDVSEIFENVLMKGSQNGIVLPVVSLGGLIAERVVIEGRLNYLRLPDDVIMVNTTEVIDGELIINNTVNATIGLSVRGNISDINLANFLMERVTLNASEAIDSALNFTNDVTIQGNVVITGKVNDILLHDITKKVAQNQTVRGIKRFKEEFNVSDLTVSGHLNGILLDKILWRSRNESARSVQFLREGGTSISTSSLTCDTINGTNITQFYTDTHDAVHDVNDKLDNFTKNILSYQDSLRSRKESIEDQTSIFNYFELHEVLDYGKIKRFLPAYEYGIIGENYELHATHMIMWTETRNSFPKTRSLIADVMHDGRFNVTKRMRGKIFPFSLGVEKENVVGFYVQAEHSRRCSPGNKKCIVIKTMYSSGITVKEKVTVPQDATLFDVRLLEVDEIFLLTFFNTEGDSERIFVYQYNVTLNKWSQHQTFHTEDLTSVDMVYIERDTDSFFEPPRIYMSVTGSNHNPGIAVYEWDFELDMFYLKTNMSTSVSSYALWLDYRDALHLLLAKEGTRVRKHNSWVDKFNEPLEVYTFEEEEELILNHTVSLKGVRSLEMFILAEEAFVLASSNHMETVYVLKFRGFNGFEVIQEIPAPSITETRVFTVDSHLYLALNSVAGPSRILKASVRGGRLDFV